MKEERGEEGRKVTYDKIKRKHARGYRAQATEEQATSSSDVESQAEVSYKKQDGRPKPQTRPQKYSRDTVTYSCAYTYPGKATLQFSP